MTEDEANDYEAWKTGRAHDEVRHVQWLRNSQAAVEKILAPIAKKLGLRIKVSYDYWDLGWHIDSALIPVRHTLTVDEGLFLRPAKEVADIAYVIERDMVDLQARLFDTTAKKMTELSADGRTFVLSKEDRSTLHEMFKEAEKSLYAPFTYGNEAGFKAQEEKRKRFQDLVYRMFK